ncbi:unnamed protein product [Rangifer tarandus platyrhynchus]|uniref:Uncharacterized protein n=2 Tax=Rangifer tarandus platyrhynchus TaxID=3082113 RepID=A0ABN8ZRS6_RANTA|nr:unnamed protein product [Rangifer tarandus platyrhynchus]CAI9710961.1 unnamed protein product [Rangifer tarandus platyrhynchus]
MGGGDPGRAPPRTRRRASPSPVSSRLRARPAPAAIRADASRPRAAGPFPSPFSPEPRTGAGSARRELLLASGKPRRSGSSSSSSWSPRTREKHTPSLFAARLTSPDASGCGDQRMRGAPSPCLSGRPERVRTSFSLGPGPLYRASEETKWPPGGNLGAQRVGAGIYVPAKNNSDPARLLLGPGAAPVGGGPPRCR